MNSDIIIRFEFWILSHFSHIKEESEKDLEKWKRTLTALVRFQK